MSLRNAANFCRRVGTGYKAGVDFLRLIDGESRHGNAKQREVLSEVHQVIRKGDQLHVAMKQHGEYFPSLLIAMTHAGEVTGKLDRTLIALADYYEDRIKIYREFKNQITWPAIQAFLALNVLAIFIYLLGVIKPAGGGEMIDITGLGLRGASGALTLYAYAFGFVAIIVGIVIAFRRNVAGVQNLIPILYKIPAAGNALQTITLARFCWTLALSLDAGIDPIRALQLSLESTGSDYYRSVKDDIEKAILNGSNMNEALLATGVFPDEFITEIEVAEISGTDAEAIQHLAEQYDVRARSAMRVLGAVASGLVRAAVVIAIVALIIKMVMGISNVYSEALQPI
jgi:type II secretory pathway component PulF